MTLRTLPTRVRSAMTTLRYELFAVRRTMRIARMEAGTGSLRESVDDMVETVDAVEMAMLNFLVGLSQADSWDADDVVILGPAAVEYELFVEVTK